jgi:Mg-chelatase subunit ChlD
VIELTSVFGTGNYPVIKHYFPKENFMSRLSEFDYVVVLDASGSMAEEDAPGNRSRWEHAEETVTTIARAAGKLDSDGIDVVTFAGSKVESHTGVNATEVRKVFESRNPNGGTPLHLALTEALKLAGKSDKKDFIVVLTDGVPDDKAAAAQVIIDAANAQETDDSLTFLFIQVGKDSRATAYLKSLDDDLKGAKFDIVDVKTIEEVEQFESIEALIEAAIAG